MTSAPFQPYGPAHLSALVTILTLPFAFSAFARTSRSREAVVDLILTVLLLANYFTYLFKLRQFGAVSWKQALPMQLCDWALFVVIVALWTRRPNWFEVAYFWGIGGTVQALLTPNLTFGFPDFRFFSFFVAHGAIVAGVVFLMLRHRLRPRPWSVLRVFAWTELYFIIALAIDAYTGFNYGFLLHKPEAKTLLSLLSDVRPVYLFQMHLLALAFFLLLYLPFAISNLVKKTATARVPP